MEILTKTAAVSIISCVCALLIKNKNPEYSFLIACLSTALLSSAAIELLSEISAFIKNTIDAADLPAAVLSPVIKCTAIAILTKIVSDICRDAGQNSTATAVEYIGSSVSVITVLPIVQSMLKTLEELQ